jgi:hypothetical protein
MPEAITINSLSAVHKRQVQALRRPVLDAAVKLGAIRERLSDLAPKVVKLYDAIKAEHTTFQYVAFVRLFDASVPTAAEEYRNHRTYYTMQYMRRLVQQAGMVGRKRGQQGVRDTAVDGLARTLATIMQIVPDTEQPMIWRAVEQELQLLPRTLARLQRRVAATKPLIRLETARPAKIGNVIHMDRTAVTEAETPAVGRQPGRDVEHAARGARKRAAA